MFLCELVKFQCLLVGLGSFAVWVWVGVEFVDAYSGTFLLWFCYTLSCLLACCGLV